MEQASNPSAAGIEFIEKERARLLGQLAIVNAGQWQDAQVLTGICTQLLAYEAMTANIINTAQAQYTAKLVEHTDKLTAQTDILIRSNRNTEKMTRWLVGMTCILTLFTFALLIFTWWQTEKLESDVNHSGNSNHAITNQYGANASGK